MKYKTLRLLFVLFFTITCSGVYSQVESAGKYEWPDFSKHSAYYFKRYPCGFNAMYYLLQRLDRIPQFSDDEKETLLQIPDIATFNHLRDSSEKVGVSLQGFQVTFSDMRDFSLMLTILDDEQYQENHYVVVEKMENTDKWLVTDWPNARYALTSNELQELTNGFVLVPAESDVKSISGPVLVVDANPITVGDHEKDADFKLQYEVFNYGTEPLNIDTINSTCQCTVPAINQSVILPGKSESISVAVSTDEKLGIWNEFITMKCNDLYLPSPIVTITGNSKPLWEISTEKLKFQYNSILDLSEKQIDVTIDFYTEKELHPDDFLIEIVSDTFFHYKFNDQFMSMKASGFAKSFNYVITLNADILVPLIVDGVVIIKHKSNPEIDIRIPLFILPPKDFRVHPQPLTLTEKNPVSFLFENGEINWNHTKVISNLDFVTVTDNGADNRTKNITITINKDYKESILPIRLINNEMQATIGIPVFSNALF